VKTVPGALTLRGRAKSLDLQQRMDVRRRVKAWSGPKHEIYALLAEEFRVSVTTIERTVLG